MLRILKLAGEGKRWSSLYITTSTTTISFDYVSGSSSTSPFAPTFSCWTVNLTPHQLSLSTDRLSRVIRRKFSLLFVTLDFFADFPINRQLSLSFNSIHLFNLNRTTSFHFLSYFLLFQLDSQQALQTFLVYFPFISFYLVLISSPNRLLPQLQF